MAGYILKRTDGTVVKPGDAITSFREETWIFRAVTQEGRRIYVEEEDGWGREFFPQVFGLKVEREADRA